jgi:predicted TIM-barrel fold metal-dependent hydrolase
MTEEILEPERPICDPHHHLWDRPESRYVLEDLLADTGSGHNIVSTVFVECAASYRTSGPPELRPVGETEFVDGIAKRAATTSTRVAAGIVAFADLNLGPHVGVVLDAHAEASARFRGIRHAAGWDASDEVRNSHPNPTEGMLATEDFRRGFGELSPRGLSFDAWLYHPQIRELTDLAREFPETTIVRDHFGGPLGIGPYEGKRSEIFAKWKDDIAELASCENVVAKLGGLVMPVNGWGFHKREQPVTSDELASSTRDWYLHTIDAFSPDRCMFESNFPVDKASCSYAVLWNSFKKIASGFSEAEKNAMFRGTAERVYRL